jgi:hypothetical protein
MSREPRTDDERHAIIHSLVSTFARRLQFGHGVSVLRTQMEARMDAVLQGTDYDRVGGRSSDTTSTTERAALQQMADQAHDDLHQMDLDLAALRDIEHRWYSWSLRYVTSLQAVEKKQEPGKGPCPAGRCTNCWDHGWSEPSGEKWKGLCDVCGRWKADHGERLIKALHEIRFRHGKPRITTADLKKHAPHLLDGVAS